MLLTISIEMMIVIVNKITTAQWDGCNGTLFKSDIKKGFIKTINWTTMPSNTDNNKYLLVPRLVLKMGFCKDLIEKMYKSVPNARDAKVTVLAVSRPSVFR